jgi:hypothetical protein
MYIFPLSDPQARIRMRFHASGPRAPQSSPRASLRIAAFGAILAAGAATFLTGCGQTPGETGLAYLEDAGLRVSAPLYSLKLDSLPLDSVFAVETPYNHYGESLLVVGRDARFTAKARLGFQLTTAGQRDSLVKGLHLRLGVLPLSGAFAGRDWLRSSSAHRDTLTLLVESFSWPNDSGSQQYADSLTAFHRRILTAPVPFSALEAQYRRRDTIRIYPSKAYPDTGVIQDSSQAGSLPNLWNRLRNEHGGDSTRKWVVYLEISPLTASDSGLFPFIAQAVGNSNTVRRYNSGLWLGRYVPDSIATVGSLLVPYRSGGLLSPASNYETVHTGSSTRSLLHGVSRGLHLRINRDTLMQRIRAKLNAYDPADPTLGDRLFASAAPGTAFDRRFYVPYARLRLPVDAALTSVQGPFALDMSLTSDVDSLDADTASFHDDIAVATGATIKLPVRGGGSASTPDTLSVSYRVHPSDTTLRQILYSWTSTPTVADTINVTPNGLRRELAARRKTGWPRSTTVGVRPQAGQLNVEVFFSVASVAEPNFILDSTGNTITSPSKLSGRFWRPGADSVAVRATHGVRNVLNRVTVAGKGSLPDMYLQSVRRAAYDTSTISSSTYRRVEYPVFGEIDFKRGAGGKLYVGLDLYLYPLEARP